MYKWSLQIYSKIVVYLYSIGPIGTYMYLLLGHILFENITRDLHFPVSYFLKTAVSNLLIYLNSFPTLFTQIAALGVYMKLSSSSQI